MSSYDEYHERISILVPTRGRYDQLQLMWQSALDTAVHPEHLELVIYVDEDDSNMVIFLDDGEPIVKTPTGGHVSWICGERITLSKMWNECYGLSTGDIVMHGNDDVIFRSERWDMEVREAFRRYPDRIACVHGRDGIHDGNMATLGFYHRYAVNALGYFVPPYFSSDYNDTWLSSVYDAIARRVFVPEIYTEHMHPAVGKGVMDQTHQDRLTRHRQDNVDALYASLIGERMADIVKLERAIQTARVSP